MTEGQAGGIGRRRLLRRVGAVGAASIAGCASARSGESSATVRIVHDTHFHGRLGGSDEPLNVATYFGLIEDLLEGADGAVAVGNGDDLHMSVESSVFDGRHVTAVLNESPVSYDAIGNHEFGGGPESLRENVADSEFTWLSANVVDEGTGEPFAADEGTARYAVEEIGGVRVGFTGLAPEETPEVTTVGDDVAVLDPAAALEGAVADLRDEGAEVIVLLSHLASPVAEAVVAEVDGVDVAVGDHASRVLDEPVEVGDTILSYVGDEFEYVGQLDLEVDGGEVVDYAFERHDVAELVADGAVEPHEGVFELLVDFEKRLEDELSEVVGETAVDLDARFETVRRAESNAGNWIADAIREDVDADVAILNAGSIRSDDLHEAGELTRRTVVDVLPFPNYTGELEVSGTELLEAIEHGVGAVDEGHGRFPQVSGLSFAYDPDAAAGGRVEELAVGGEGVDLEATYELGTTDFLMDGGDGYEVFAEATVLVPPDEGTLLSTLVATGIEEAGTIAPETEGRIETV